MKTLIDVNDDLINSIKEKTGIGTKKEIINLALIEYSNYLKRKELSESSGKFKLDYNVLKHRELEFYE